jgi:hypothetical protein
VGPVLRTIITAVIAVALIWASFIVHPATVAGVLLGAVVVGSVGFSLILILFRRHE